MRLLDLNRDVEVRGIAREPFLNVERADDRCFALALGLGKFHRVFCIFFFLELNRFRFLWHNYFRFLVVINGAQAQRGALSWWLFQPELHPPCARIRRDKLSLRQADNSHFDFRGWGRSTSVRVASAAASSLRSSGSNLPDSLFSLRVSKMSSAAHLGSVH